MSELQTKLRSSVTSAMKSGDKVLLGTCRNLLAALHNDEIAKRRLLTTDEENVVLTREVRRRDESIIAFAKGGRQDLVDKETAERDLIQSWLPAPLTEQQVRDMVTKTLESMKLVSSRGYLIQKDMGKVMSIVMPLVNNLYPGSGVKFIVQELMSVLPTE